MTTDKEIRFEELAVEQADVLPAREALSLFNWANVNLSQSILALNAVTANSVAQAVGSQTVTLTQS